MELIIIVVLGIVVISSLVVLAYRIRRHSRISPVGAGTWLWK